MRKWLCQKGEIDEWAKAKWMMRRPRSSEEEERETEEEISESGGGGREVEWSASTQWYTFPTMLTWKQS